MEVEVEEVAQPIHVGEEEVEDERSHHFVQGFMKIITKRDLDLLHLEK